MSDVDVLSLLSKKHRHGDVILIAFTIISIICCFIPYYLSYTRDDSLSSAHDRNMIVITFLLMSLGISLSKTYEFLRERAVIKGLLMERMPYRFGYFMVALSTVVCYAILFIVMEVLGDSLLPETILSVSQLLVITSVLSIIASSNPLPQPTYILNISISTTFIASIILQTISLSQQADESMIYFISSSILLTSSTSLFIILIYLKIQHFKKQYESWSEIFFEKSIFLILSGITASYLLSKLITSIGFVSCLQYDNWETVEILLICIYSSVILHLPHRMICQELINTKDELESKHTYVSCIAHEIRSPLSTVIQGIDLLLKDINDSELGTRTMIAYHEIKEVIGYIKLSSELATKTLNDLLSFDKIRSNRMQLEFQLSNALLFINHSLKPFHVQARANSVILTSKFDGFNADTVGIMIDKTKMEQVFRNFISNALKFSPTGSSVTIDVSVTDKFSSIPKLKHIVPTGVKGVIRVAVIDQGAGIAIDNQHKLFDKYVQINANKLQAGKGSGLGLWLSKAFVERHGGVIGMSSAGEGFGSTFYFELPYFESKPLHHPIRAANHHSYRRVGRQSSVSRSIVDSIHDVAAEFAAELMTNNLRSYDNFDMTTSSVIRKRRQSFPAIRKQKSRVESPSDVDSQLGCDLNSSSYDITAGITDHIDVEKETSLPPKASRSSIIQQQPHHEDHISNTPSLQIDTQDLALQEPVRSISFSTSSSSSRLSFHRVNSSSRSKRITSSSRTNRVMPSNSIGSSNDGIDLDSQYIDAIPDLYQPFSLASHLSTTPSASLAPTDQIQDIIAISSSSNQVIIRPSPKPSSYFMNMNQQSPFNMMNPYTPTSSMTVNGSITIPISTSAREASSSSSTTVASSSIIPSYITTSYQPSSTSSSTITSSTMTSYQPSTSSSSHNLDGDQAIKILLVDDSDIGRKMVERLLRPIHANLIDHAEDGSIAVAMIRHDIHRYDIILMDYHMPKMNGIDATTMIRALGYDGIILGVTASGDDADAAAFVRQGADDVVEKPLTIDSFNNAIRKHQRVNHKIGVHSNSG